MCTCRKVGFVAGHSFDMCTAAGGKVDLTPAQVYVDRPLAGVVLTEARYASGNKQSPSGRSDGDGKK